MTLKQELFELVPSKLKMPQPVNEKFVLFAVKISLKQDEGRNSHAHVLPEAKNVHVCFSQTTIQESKRKRLQLRYKVCNELNFSNAEVYDSINAITYIKDRSIIRRRHMK